MAWGTKISWCDATFNPWIGCQKVSTGCTFCYAERDMTRKPRWANCWGPPETSVRLKTKTWNDPVRWNKKAKKNGTRPRVFCASLADVFEDNPQVEEWRYELSELITATPHLDWLILTKRPEVALRYSNWTADNIWMGTSIEDQDTANERIPQLLKIPAAIHWVSAEPLLAQIEFNQNWFEFYDPYEISGRYPAFRSGLNWVIVGGESGPRAREMNPDWARLIRNQCGIAGIPFFFKQMTKKVPIPDDLMIREFPK